MDVLRVGMGVSADCGDVGGRGECAQEQGTASAQDESSCPPVSVTNGALTSVARLRAAFAVQRMVETIAVPREGSASGRGVGGARGQGHGSAEVVDTVIFDNGTDSRNQTSIETVSRFYTLQDLCSRSRPGSSSASPCLSFDPLGFWPAAGHLPRVDPSST